MNLTAEQTALAAKIAADIAEYPEAEKRKLINSIGDRLLTAKAWPEVAALIVWLNETPGKMRR